MFIYEKYCKNIYKNFKIYISYIFLSIYILNQLFELFIKPNQYKDGKKFIDKCLNNPNIKNYYNFTESPKLSVIIPVFNCQNTILYPVSSIQNQNLSEFEIILFIIQEIN